MIIETIAWISAESIIISPELINGFVIAN